MWCLDFTIYLSRIGINNKGINPPKTIPKAAERKLGSSTDAIKSAITWATTTPKIQAT